MKCSYCNQENGTMINNGKKQMCGTFECMERIQKENKKYKKWYAGSLLISGIPLKDFGFNDDFIKEVTKPFEQLKKQNGEKPTKLEILLDETEKDNGDDK